MLLRQLRSFSAQERSRNEIWSLHAAALFTAAAGLLNVLSALTPSVGSRFRLLERFLPVEARHGARLAAALAGFALLMLARGLWRRKRVAWFLAIGALAVSAVSHLVKGLDYEEALLVSALLVWLWVQRSQYHARSDAASVWQGAKALLSATVFTLAYGVAGFYLLDRHFSVSFGPGAALKQTIIMFTQFYDPGLQPVTSLGRYFADSIYAVGAATFSYGLAMLFRPVLMRQPATSDERARAKAIVEAHGRSSLARFALLGDKAYCFSPGGSVVAYVLKGRIALALGDPIGPMTDARAAIGAFRAYCARNDWQAAFYQTLPDLLPDYRAEGMEYISVGQEAIVRLEGFELAGHENKALRSAVNRLTKLGYRPEMHDPPLSESLLSELRIISDEWLGLVRGAEKRFSLGWFEDNYIRGSRVMVVHDTLGVPIAFANVVPEYQMNETSVDLMRHRRQVEHGVMDLLFVALFEWAKKGGYTGFNLGLSALAGVGERSEDAALERAMHYIYQHVDQFYDFQGLHQFKAKFHPEWSPRYLVYPGAANLPAVAMALIRADSGDGFVRSYARSAVGKRATGLQTG